MPIIRKNRQTAATRRRLRHLAPLAIVVLCVGPVLAQQSEEGGVLLRLGLSQELRNQSNPDLDIPAGPSESQARTLLSLDLTSRTRTQELALSASGALEAGQNREDGLVGPRVQLSYSREAATSRFGLTAFLREQDVETLDFLLDDLDGNPIVTTVSGTGTRRQTGGNLSLDFGQDAPFGGRVTLGQTDTDYLGTSDPSLIDSQRRNASLALRFELSPATNATARLSLSRLEEDGAPASDTAGLSFGLSHARPDGTYDVAVSLTRSETGTRESLTFGRSLDLASGTLSVRLGLSSQEAGGANVIGGLSWQQDLPRGRLGIRFDHQVTSDEDDTETAVSRLSMSVSQDLSTRLSGTLRLGLQDSSETASGLSTRTIDLSSSLRYELTEDWGLSLGVSRRERDKDTTGTARSTTVFMNLNRSFDFRF